MRYRVAVLRKNDLPPFGPLVSPTCSSLSSTSLSDFILETSNFFSSVTFFFYHPSLLFSVIQANQALLHSEASKQRVVKARENMLDHMYESTVEGSDIPPIYLSKSDK